MKKALKKILDLETFFQSLPAARVLSRANGEILLVNGMANKLLDIKNSQRWKNLKNLIELVSQYKNEIVKDYPAEGRIIRYHGQYLDLGKNGKFIFVMLSDVTDDWLGERQKDVLEFIASTASQRLPTSEWINSILKRIVVMIGIKSASIMLYNEPSKTLETVYSSAKMKGAALKLNLNEGLAGVSAKNKTSLALYTGIDRAHRKLIYKSPAPGSYLAVPMVIGTKIVGVLTIRDKAGIFFREQDKTFYEIVANRIAITLEYRDLLERLKEDYERLTTVITHTFHGKALLNNNNEIIMANPALAELLEMNLNDLPGKCLDELLPELKNILDPKTEQAEKEIELHSLESRPWVQIGLAKIKRKDGKNTVVTIRDITAEKQLEETKNDFIATATHELRTPLTAILGYLSMINNRPVNLDDKQKTYLQRIGKAAGTLSELVEDLLSVLRIDQEATKFNPEKLKLLPIVKETVHVLETKTAHKKIRIKIPKENYFVHCDVNALQKVILNLIDNAVKYTHRNGRITVKFSPIKAGGKKMIRVSIKDSGVGISKRQQERLFEKFERVQNELSVEAGGTGLGLYITKKLVEQWGGRIKVTSTLRRGSIFTFSIPAY